MHHEFFIFISIFYKETYLPFIYNTLGFVLMIEENPQILLIHKMQTSENSLCFPR